MNIKIEISRSSSYIEEDLYCSVVVNISRIKCVHSASAESSLISAQSKRESKDVSSEVS